MAAIEVDEKVAALLRAQADAHQLPLSDFLRELAALATPVNAPPVLSEEEWNRVIDDASGDFPVLPRNFSRADIYSDHD